MKAIFIDKLGALRMEHIPDRVATPVIYYPESSSGGCYYACDEPIDSIPIKTRNFYALGKVGDYVIYEEQ